MDESGEASVGSFRIGPSTLLGRGVALRVLLFSSLWRLRACAYAAISRVRGAALPVAASWLHLRNTHGVLLMVVLFALFLRKLSGARSRAALARRRRQYEKAMLRAGTYEVWARAAKVLDRMSEQVRRISTTRSSSGTGLRRSGDGGRTGRSGTWYSACVAILLGTWGTCATLNFTRAG
ncbi:putative phospholipase, patatin family protein [Zea mays]|jgi:TAG lipase / steryl ester hydrolase / phospholipase A2 / LPA acyltransferase|uniref:Uncharacterized protein n=1 Tax=Zea mays TaxID=4577 RepID=C0PP02_MAIZE|nr:putative phospholipase, patatin family protein [Zea mays]ACN36918.1 unknown [Zea mays]|eukprot:NP_001170408.1 putative phospholipase, patatin family protein [Zea mays]